MCHAGTSRLSAYCRRQPAHRDHLGCWLRVGSAQDRGRWRVGQAEPTAGATSERTQAPGDDERRPAFRRPVRSATHQEEARSQPQHRLADEVVQPLRGVDGWVARAVALGRSLGGDPTVSRRLLSDGRPGRAISRAIISSCERNGPSSGYSVLRPHHLRDVNGAAVLRHLMAAGPTPRLEIAIRSTSIGPGTGTLSRPRYAGQRPWAVAEAYRQTVAAAARLRLSARPCSAPTKPSPPPASRLMTWFCRA
jgi:hypothetical protein